MSAVYHPILKLRGSKEIGVFDMIPQTSSHSYHEPNVAQMRSKDQHDNTYRKELMNNAIQKNYALKPKGCKEESQLHQVIRRPPLDPMRGLYPQVGWARHQRKGLAYDPKKPIDGKLMPLADSFYAALNSKLGQPKA